VGVLGYCLGGKLAYLAACRTDCDVAVGYYGVGIERALDEAASIRNPLVLHFAEDDQLCPPEARSRIYETLQGRTGVDLYTYPGCEHAFARVGGDHYNKPAANIAHERSIAATKSAIGPHFDLAALWEQHVWQEFVARDADATIATMVPEPYVN